MMLTPTDVLPQDHDQAVLVGRIYSAEVRGPVLVLVQGTDLIDITDLGPTMSVLLAREDLHSALQSARGRAIHCSLQEVLHLATGDPIDAERDHLLSPVDLHVIKAAGVTFVESMLERVIEERSMGDPATARKIRDELNTVIGGAIESIVPGSPEAANVKAVLIRDGLWSPYLEVGIGPDPEVFTKAPVLSSVGAGQEIGIRSTSVWNNPEPEVVLIVTFDGKIAGITLGNDVNLRDIEGRSALLLGEAKDNNGSCALGPFIRLITDTFSMDDVRELDINLQVIGAEGFELNGFSSMRNISRDPESLVGHVLGKHHQYPDGFVLFTGTLFAPTQDRYTSGEGFTHALGDVVRISTPKLGALINMVTHSEKATPWTYGLWQLITNLNQRDLLSKN
jgi:fumarylacetoacetate (FAA) hydrolase family protein